MPLAISVVSQAQLEASGVRQFQDLGRIAPSLTVRPAEHPVNANVSLRGVGTFAFGIGVEPSVAVLVDEVPLAFQARAFTDLPDVERIEVLRGPQSTLYGKAASAGLINIITRQPTDSFHFRANALATTDSEYGGNFSVSGPMTPELGYVLSASYSNWDGNVRNLFNGKKVNGREAFNTRAKLRWEPTDDVTVTLSGNYLNGSTTVGRPFIRMDPAALLRNTAGLTQAATMPGVTINEDNQNVSNNYDSRTKYEGGGGSLRAEIGLGDMTLVSISSYDRFRLNDYLDHDDTSSSSAFGANIQVGTFNSKLFTQEIRLLSPGDKPFRYTLGAYYANVKFDRPFLRGPLSRRPTGSRRRSRSSSRPSRRSTGRSCRTYPDWWRARPEREGLLHLQGQSRGCASGQFLQRPCRRYRGHLSSERALRSHARRDVLCQLFDRLQGSDL